ncbi:LCP family protein [Domibacillus iocasae]|uniref:Trascriptional regulator n=1 Tax=Domibacillus iocasae TaxID=1714016 RepID=A0A1E7DPE9_9BACI|nr:LCP family protein [Domibacillus iocasae]OES44966.1 trascriptional regulator [Domibacillus iocasae]
MERRERRKKKGKLKRILLIGFLLVLFLISGIVFFAYQSFQQALGGEELTSDKRTEEVKLNNEDGFTVLLLGVDERENDGGRSDTMILASVRSDSVKMVSIPRDTRVEIAGKGTQDKINHAFAYGGIDMAAKTVENFLDVPVDYYVEMNMEGLQEMVDAVGGVDVDNPFAFSYQGDNFAEGSIHLNGAQALNYARMRYEDPQGDFGRQARQRQVIQGVIAKGSDPSMLLKYGDVLDAIGNNLNTNLSIGEIASIQKNYGDARNNIESEAVEGDDQKIEGVYYYIVSEEERDRLSAVLREHLGLQE